jgi:uncharacterized membrane protein (DUF373 family)
MNIPKLNILDYPTGDMVRKLWNRAKDAWKDSNFLHNLENLEIVISKVLSIAMVLVTLVAVYDLIVFLVFNLAEEVIDPNAGRFSDAVFKIFGLFLNILIALEILENITAYLKKHVVQVELVIITSLIAVARKIILLDFEKIEGIELIGLAIAIFALSGSYWLIRKVNAELKDKDTL